MRGMAIVTVLCLTSRPALACVFDTDCKPGVMCVNGNCNAIEMLRGRLSRPLSCTFAGLHNPPKFARLVSGDTPRAVKKLQWSDWGVFIVLYVVRSADAGTVSKLSECHFVTGPR